MKKINVSSGDKYGRFTVLEEVNNISGRRFFLCRCECGEVRTIKLASLRSGNTVSCGCYKKELVQKRSTTHGCSKRNNQTQTYRSWAEMIKRCTDKKGKSWKYYGGRGIVVCEMWYKFEKFFEDMGEKPNGTSLDRIDNSGNYCKENCRWATKKVQARNMRSNRIVTVGGENITLAEASERYGVNYYTLHSRLNKLKWDLPRALTQ